MVSCCLRLIPLIWSPIYFKPDFFPSSGLNNFAVWFSYMDTSTEGKQFQSQVKSCTKRRERKSAPWNLSSIACKSTCVVFSTMQICIANLEPVNTWVEFLNLHFSTNKKEEYRPHFSLLRFSNKSALFCAVVWSTLWQ